MVKTTMRPARYRRGFIVLFLLACVPGIVPQLWHNATPARAQSPAQLGFDETVSLKRVLRFDKAPTEPRP